MNVFPVCLLLFALGMSGLQAQQRAVTERPRPGNAYEAVKEVPGLPRVLLIGDSISEGYTLPVRKLLEGKANVYRIPVNGGPAKTAGEKIDKWLGQEKWDVIHFNWGLHDLMFFPSKTVDPAKYEKDLRLLVARLKQTGARLIWATSTPVPDQMTSPRSPPNRSAVVKQYNEVAAKVMKENEVPVDDLYTRVLPVEAAMQRAHDVHFNMEGSEFLAKQVAASIAAALPGAK
jgi:hypothetical protein